MLARPRSPQRPVAQSAAAQPTQASAAAHSGQQATISLSFIASGSEQMAPLVDAFQKANPNIKVNVQYLPQATLGQATVTALQAGNAADVLYTNGDTGQLHSVFALGKSGYLTDLSQRAWAKDVPSVAHDMFYDGTKLYGVPMGLSTRSGARRGDLVHPVLHLVDGDAEAGVGSHQIAVFASSRTGAFEFLEGLARQWCGPSE